MTDRKQQIAQIMATATMAEKIEMLDRILNDGNGKETDAFIDELCETADEYLKVRKQLLRMAEPEQRSEYNPSLVHPDNPSTFGGKV